jgi:hypothetical protein
MGLSRTGRFLLVAALLLAQQSALAHPIWHAAKADLRGASTDAGKIAGNPLCAQHQALDAVLGALNGTPQASPELQAVAQRVVVLPAAPAPAPALTPSSRGPPVLS